MPTSRDGKPDPEPDARCARCNQPATPALGPVRATGTLIPWPLHDECWSNCRDGWRPW